MTIRRTNFNLDEFRRSTNDMAGISYQPLNLTVLIETNNSMITLQSMDALLRQYYPNLKYGTDIIMNEAYGGQKKLLGHYVTGNSLDGCYAIGWIAKSHGLSVVRLTLRTVAPVKDYAAFLVYQERITKWFHLRKKQTRHYAKPDGVEYGGHSTLVVLRLRYLYYVPAVAYDVRLRGDYAREAFSRLSHNTEDGWLGWQYLCEIALNTATEPGFLMGSSDGERLKLTTTAPDASKAETAPATIEDWVLLVAPQIVDWLIHEDDAKASYSLFFDLLQEEVANELLKRNSQKVLLRREDVWGKINGEGSTSQQE